MDKQLFFIDSVSLSPYASIDERRLEMFFGPLRYCLIEEDDIDALIEAARRQRLFKETEVSLDPAPRINRYCYFIRIGSGSVTLRRAGSLLTEDFIETL